MRTFRVLKCGFEAVRADRARTLVPLVQDRGWLFDTELLVLSLPRRRRVVVSGAQVMRSAVIGATSTLAYLVPPSNREREPSYCVDGESAGA